MSCNVTTPATNLTGLNVTDIHHEEVSASGFVTGVILSIVADIIIAVSLNIQKYAHNANMDSAGEPIKPFYTIPTWWAGMLLNIGGELGNMFAYGFAPASVVAPVGSVGVVANAVIAVTWLKEPFRGRDGVGLVAVITGVVLVIFGVPEGEAKLNMPVLLHEYYNQAATLSYWIFLCCLVAFFVLYLEPRFARKTIFVWLLLCSGISSMTVIACRGVRLTLWRLTRCRPHPEQAAAAAVQPPGRARHRPPLLAALSEPLPRTAVRLAHSRRRPRLRRRRLRRLHR